MLNDADFADLLRRMQECEFRLRSVTFDTPDCSYGPVTVTAHAEDPAPECGWEGGFVLDSVLSDGREIKDTLPLADKWELQAQAADAYRGMRA